MSEEKNPLESALEVFVYGPLGLIITLTEEMPALVEKGRQRLTSQLNMARMMGEMAAPHLQTEAEKLVRGVMDRVAPVAPPIGPNRRDAGGPHAGSGAPPTRGPAAPPSPSPTPPPSPSRAAPVGPAGAPEASAPAPPRAPAHAPGAPSTEPSPSGNGSTGRVVDSTHLAIPGYDTLSAMQVVQRLAGLSAPELEAVVAYESAHRGRKTILNRAEQLRSEAAG